MLIVTDIDDVICDSGWRKGLLPDYNAYHEAALRDPPHGLIITMLNAFHAHGYPVWAMTGRPEKFRQLTNDWLIKHNVKLDHLVMRPDDNYMTSPELKLYFLSMLKNESSILIFDDREDVITALRGHGYNVLQVFNQRAEPR